MNISPGAFVDESVVFGPSCENVTIGHGCKIMRDVRVDVKNLTIGEYTTIHHGSVLTGETVNIGHNCWFGHYCILDGHGGLLDIHNNVAAGAHSQLWSHIKFGDVLAGCRWHRMESLVIEDDVWFVGHCIVASIVARKRSMLMVGGVAVKEMKENHVYAGTPAKDMTDVFGPQFGDPGDVTAKFRILVDEYAATGADTSFIEIRDGDWPETEKTVFSPGSREYQPRYSDEETAFMRFLLHDKAKFVPR